MKVMGHPLSPCTRKVLMILAEKDAACEFEAVDVLGGAHKAARHLALHPFGVIPVLDDDGFILYESRAILRYLDVRCPGPVLTPREPKAFGRMEQWLSVDQAYLSAHTRVLAIERILKRQAGVELDAAAVEAAETAIAHALGVFEQTLQASAYLAGTSYSLADISLFTYVVGFPVLGVPQLLANFPRLSAWHEQIAQRPAWQRVRALAEKTM